MGGSASKSTHDCDQHYNLESKGRSVFTCDGCKTEGFGPRYVCNLCDDTLHKVCRYPKTSVSHDYFDSSCIFTFNEGNLAEVPCKLCVACGKDVRGFNYHCPAENLTLHPMCYKLEKKIAVDGKILNLRNKLVSNCAGCDTLYAKARWAYVSSCNTDVFHVHCLNERVYEFHMKNEDTCISGATANQVEPSDVDLNSIIESYFNSANGSTTPIIESYFNSANGSTTPNQVFTSFLMDDVEKEAEPGIFGRISKFFKTLYHKVISGIVLTWDKVQHAAASFYFKIKLWWCDQVVDFFGSISQLFKVVLPYLEEGGPVITPEKLYKLAKPYNLNFTHNQCQKIVFLLQEALTIFSGLILKHPGKLVH